MIKIATVHNFYQQSGGEGTVFRDETALLEGAGHEVHRHTFHNRDIENYSRTSRARLGLTAVWNRGSYEQVRALVQKHRIDVVHVHNTVPLASPSVYRAAVKEGAAVVQTLHNYRFACPNGLLFRNGRICTDCVGRRFAWPGVVHRCYRGSAAVSASVAATQFTHRILRTWTRYVDRYISMTAMGKARFVEAGLPAEKIIVKPHFAGLPDTETPAGSGTEDFVLFVGRHVKEKGIETLLAAWDASGVGSNLYFVGDGPEAGRVQEVASRRADVRWLGQLPKNEVFDLMARATAVVVPSEWFETFGMVIVESFAVGTPCIVSEIGALGEIVDHGRTGLVFEPGSVTGLADCLRKAHSDPEAFRRMGEAAQSEYRRRYSPSANYDQLIRVYDEAIESRRLANTAKTA